MKLDEYQDEARRTAARPMNAYPRAVKNARYVLLNMSQTGLNFDGVCQTDAKPYDRAALVKELGDTLWYLSNLADAHGIRLSEVAEANVAKLRARYPDGFSVKAAAAKADES